MGVDFYPCDACKRARHEEFVHEVSILGKRRMLCNDCIETEIDNSDAINTFWLENEECHWGLVIRTPKHKKNGGAVLVSISFKELWHLDCSRLPKQNEYGVYMDDGPVDAVEELSKKDFVRATETKTSSITMIQDKDRVDFANVMLDIMSCYTPMGCLDKDETSDVFKYLRTGEHGEFSAWVEVPEPGALAETLPDDHALVKATNEAAAEVEDAKITLATLKAKLASARAELRSAQQELESKAASDKWVVQKLATVAAGAKTRAGTKRKRPDSDDEDDSDTATSA